MIARVVVCVEVCKSSEASVLHYVRALEVSGENM